MEPESLQVAKISFLLSSDKTELRERYGQAIQELELYGLRLRN